MVIHLFYTMVETKKALKIKKKKWFPIVTTKEFNELVIGETLATDGSELMGRHIEVNLMTITNDMKKQNYYASFIVNEVKNDKAIAKAVGFYVSPSSIKRMVRRGKERVDDSGVFLTSDKVKIRVKIFLLAKTKTKGSIAAMLRKQAATYLNNYISKNPFDKILLDLISTSLQRNLRDYLRKVYPLKSCEVRAVEIAKEGKYKKIEAELMTSSTTEDKEIEKNKEEVIEATAEAPEKTIEEVPEAEVKKVKHKKVKEEKVEELVSE